MGIRSIQHVTAATANAYKADIAQDLQMLGHRGLLDPKLHDNVPYWTFLQREVAQNFAPARFGDGVERIGRGSGSCHELFIYSYIGICQALFLVVAPGAVGGRSRIWCNRLIATIIADRPLGLQADLL